MAVSFKTRTNPNAVRFFEIDKHVYIIKLNTNKTELIWTGSKNSLLRQGRCLPALQLGHDSTVASDHVRLLKATISSDLSPDRHVANVSSTGFYWLRQLRRVRRSLDMDSATTLVHAFVSSRVDYCSILLAGAPKVVSDRLQRVMNAAARVLSSTHKYDRGLSRLLHSELHRKEFSTNSAS